MQYMERYLSKQEVNLDPIIFKIVVGTIVETAIGFISKIVWDWLNGGRINKSDYVSHKWYENHYYIIG